MPGFSQNVIFDEEVTCYLRPLHELVMKGSNEFGKGEAGLQRRLNGGNALLQQFFGLADTNIFQVAVRRNTL